MRFKRYARGSIVALDDAGNLMLRAKHGSLLRTREGVPRVVIEHADVPDLQAILECIVLNSERHVCESCGIEVTE